MVGQPPQQEDIEMIWYYAFMGLLVLVLFVWAIIAFREDAPRDEGNGGAQE